MVVDKNIYCVQGELHSLELTHAIVARMHGIDKENEANENCKKFEELPVP